MRKKIVVMKTKLLDARISSAGSLKQQQRAEQAVAVAAEILQSGGLVDYYEKLENLVNLDAVFNRFHVNLQNSSDIPETLREEIIRYLCPYLAYSIANMVHLLDIQHCVLAGIIPMALGYPLIEHLQKSLDRLLPYDYIKVEAPCSNNTGIIGGAVTVFNRQLETLFQESP